MNIHPPPFFVLENGGGGRGLLGGIYKNPGGISRIHRVILKKTEI
jgi:hypothetical protein